MGELFFHNTFHEANNIGEKIYHHHDGDGHEHVSAHCYCLQDFTVPTDITLPMFWTEPKIQYLTTRYAVSIIFRIQENIVKVSLRGPPSC